MRSAPGGNLPSASASPAADDAAADDPAAEEAAAPGAAASGAAADDAEVDDSAARGAAHVAAYEMLELSQNEYAADRITPLLAEAEANEWFEVVFMLRYALLARVMPAGGDPGDHLAAMFTAARAADDLALTALSLATQAEHSAYDPASGQEDEGTLARAVAMLEGRGGSPVDRPTAYVACGLAYQARGLWELEEEMYARAAAELTVPLPPPLDRAQELTGRVVLINQLEAQLAGACALFEIGERDRARAYAGRRPEPTAEQLRHLPRQFARDLVGVRYLLAAIAQEPEPEPFEAALEASAEPIWPGYRACILLGRSVRLLDGGHPAEAAELAQRALPDLDANYLPTVRTLALHLAAAGDSAPSALRYAAELAQLRWRARLRLLVSSRARLEAERVMLENEHLARRAYVDELTGLANRHAYARQIARMRRARTDHAIAVLMIDIDRFKQVNDRYGHGIGDEVLRRIGALLLEHSHAGDLVARLGGDEFIIVLDQVRRPEAVVRGEALVRAVATHHWRELAEHLEVTVSIGLACGAAQLVDELLRTADENLYRAKTSGRGRLVCDTASVLTRLDTRLDHARPARHPYRGPR
jgi:diguanylate cyclase (GGDEF)-like protein